MVIGGSIRCKKVTLIRGTGAVHCLVYWERGLEVPCSCIFLGQACISGTNNCLRTSGHLQLTEDRGDMVAYGLGTEDEAFGNGWIGIAQGDEGQDLPFALG